MRRRRVACTYLDVPLLQFLGVSAVDARDPAAGIELAQTPKALNAVDALHGGAIATVLDVAAYLAILPQLAGDEEAVTHMVSLSYLARPEAGGASRFGAAMEWRHVRHLLRKPHHYVRDIGVLPDMQGRDSGSALLGPIFERCGRKGLPAYLEASSEPNAALYERLGFRAIRELSVGSSPPLRLMLRPPTPSAVKG
jgi:uncharacterized protein (TIGR00369 family)